MYSIPIAPTITTRMLDKVIFLCTKKPIATPAREIWDRVSAINACLRKTRKTPNIGARMAINPPAQNARCMNSKLNIPTHHVPPFLNGEVYPDNSGLHLVHG